MPLRYTVRGYSAVEQDTDDEVAVCVEVICLHQIGSRVEKPDFGIPDPTFSLVPIDTSELEAQVQAYEPRAVLALDQEEDALDPGKVTLTINVTTAEGEEI